MENNLDTIDSPSTFLFETIIMRIDDPEFFLDTLMIFNSLLYDFHKF